MSDLIINRITNRGDDQDDHSYIDFDTPFSILKNHINNSSDLKLSGDVEKKYVQFQYDCVRDKGMVSGTKISRYSKKHKDVQAYIEVTKIIFQEAKDEKEKLALLQNMLLNVLRQINDTLNKSKLVHDVPQLIEKLEKGV